MFLESCLQNSQENTCVRYSILIKLQVLVRKEDTLAQVFSCEFSEISKNNFFTEHVQTTASNLSFSEATTGGVLWKKVFLKISQNSQENTRGFRNFQEHRTSLDDYFWLFSTTLLTWGTANSVWKTSYKYTLSRNTNLRSTVQLYHFFLAGINFQCMFSLVYTVYCQKQPPK